MVIHHILGRCAVVVHVQGAPRKHPAAGTSRRATEIKIRLVSQAVEHSKSTNSTKALEVIGDLKLEARGKGHLQPGELRLRPVAMQSIVGSLWPTSLISMTGHQAALLDKYMPSLRVEP